jgi:hypothetical protein
MMRLSSNHEEVPPVAAPTPQSAGEIERQPLLGFSSKVMIAGAWSLASQDCFPKRRGAAQTPQAQ